VRPDGSIVERYANATDGITFTTSNCINSHSTFDRDDQVQTVYVYVLVKFLSGAS
jgi:hypothetical protein